MDIGACRSSWVLQQRLSHPDDGAFGNVGHESEITAGENNNGGAMLKITHFLALAECRCARDSVGALVFQVQHVIEEIQLDAGDQDGGYRDRCEAGREGSERLPSALFPCHSQ